MKPDGSVIIDTKLVDGGMEKGFESLKKEMDSVGVKATEIGDKVALSFSKMDVSKPIANAAAKINSLETQLAATTARMKEASFDGDDKAVESLYNKRIRIYDQLELAREKLANEIIAAAQKEAAAEEKSTKRKFKSATKGAEQFGRRISRIASGALIFNVISSALRNVSDYFGSALKSNDQFAKSFAKLKGALLTALQPLYETIVPVLTRVINILTAIAEKFATLFANLAGKSVGQMAKNAEALYEQAKATDKLGQSAKKAQKYLAGFDELNVANKKESSNSTEVSPDFSGFDNSPYQSGMEGVIALTAVALLGLGAILTFSGANIPLGIGLMAAGAGLLYQTATEDWGAMQNALSAEMGAIFAIVSGASLVLGAILTFTGASTGLGIGLMAAGAVGLATVVTANWGSIKESLQGPIGEIVNILSTALLVIGAILAFSGAGLGLGIGLMVAGALGLAAVYTANWDSMVGPISDTISTIMVILGGAMLVIGIIMCLTGAGVGIGLALIMTGLAGTITAASMGDNPLTRFVKGLVNGILGLINMLIEAINSLFHIKFDGLNIGGVQIIPKLDFRLLKIPQIPLLAKGAVIPPNAPFMAMLGDQRHGTNIEAPLSTIQDAVRAEIGATEDAIIAAAEAVIERQERILNAIEGIEIGDSVIGRAANRYNSRLAITRGG